MNIELKNVKYAAFASEETSCFEAAIYVDGVKAGEARNSGKGGCTMVTPYDLQKKIDAYAATLPEKAFPKNLGGGTYKQSAETIIDDLLYDWLIARDLAKALSKKILFNKSGSPSVFETKAMKAEALAANLKRNDLPQVLKAEKILNLMPFDLALQAYRAGLKGE